MQVYHGKSVFGGVAVGKIRVYRKEEKQVRRRSVEDPETENLEELSISVVDQHKEILSDTE